MRFEGELLCPEAHASTPHEQQASACSHTAPLAPPPAPWRPPPEHEHLPLALKEGQHFTNVLLKPAVQKQGRMSGRVLQSGLMQRALDPTASRAATSHPPPALNGHIGPNSQQGGSLSSSPQPPSPEIHHAIRLIQAQVAAHIQVHAPLAAGGPGRAGPRHLAGCAIQASH